MGRWVSIGQAAKLAGVSVETLREWEKEGKISAQRTQGGHRRYDVDQFIEPTPRQTVAYARVSSHDQKQDLLAADGRFDGLLSTAEMGKYRAYCRLRKWTELQEKRLDTTDSPNPRRPSGALGYHPQRQVVEVWQRVDFCLV